MIVDPIIVFHVLIVATAVSDELDVSRGSRIGLLPHDGHDPSDDLCLGTVGFILKGPRPRDCYKHAVSQSIIQTVTMPLRSRVSKS